MDEWIVISTCTIKIPLKLKRNSLDIHSSCKCINILIKDSDDFNISKCNCLPED